MLIAAKVVTTDRGEGHQRPRQRDPAIAANVITVMTASTATGRKRWRDGTSATVGARRT
jgi:hypothetical protein